LVQGLHLTIHFYFELYGKYVIWLLTADNGHSDDTTIKNTDNFSYRNETIPNT